MKQNKIVFYLLMILIGSFIYQGCASSKDCGCGANINKVGKIPKKYRK